MNKGLQMMLKALGIEIPPEHIAILQALIPQLPAKINEAAQTINAALANFDARLRVLEIEARLTREVLTSRQPPEEGLHDARGTTTVLGSGADTGRTVRRGGRANSGVRQLGTNDCGPGNTGG